MIVVRLMGGLGNQMHQFAFGQFLQEVQGREVVFDADSFADDRLRSYELGAWKVAPRMATAHERRLFPRRFGGAGWLAYATQGRPLPIVREKPYGFHPRYHKLPARAYCEGYWQGEQFYPGLRSHLRRLFQPAAALHSTTRQWAEQIERVRSVTVHVRRTDYLKYPDLNVCTAEYYHRAVTQLLDRYDRIELFVFSDDIAWCRTHLQFACPTHYIDRTLAVGPHEDLWLMTRCLHHVIPNSSFSWWGAWLAEGGGDVLAPARWFARASLGGDEIVPDYWQRIDLESATALRRAA